MLTVLVAAPDAYDPNALAETLAALVPAAVDGLVRRVHIITPAAPADGVADLIDVSGADHVIATGDAAAMWRSQFPTSGAEWRLCLLAGMTPIGDWADSVARHIARPNAGSATFTMDDNLQRRAIATALRVSGRIHAPSGLLVCGAWPTSISATRLPARIEDRRARP